MPKKAGKQGQVLDVKALDVALVYAELPQYVVATRVNISPTTLSNLRRGAVDVEKAHEICSDLENELSVPPGGLRFGKFHE